MLRQKKRTVFTLTCLEKRAGRPVGLQTLKNAHFGVIRLNIQEYNVFIYKKKTFKTLKKRTILHPRFLLYGLFEEFSLIIFYDPTQRAKFCHNLALFMLFIPTLL